jgi:hypothetical protein
MPAKVETAYMTLPTPSAKVTEVCGNLQYFPRITALIYLEANRPRCGARNYVERGPNVWLWE